MKIHIALILAIAGSLIQTEGKTIRLALVAGHNRGFDDDPRLQFAETDAQRISELLVEAGSVDEDDLILLKSPRPEEMDRAFKEIADKKAAIDPADDVVFLFYYSGHGTNNYLKLGRREYPLQQLKENIERIPAKLRIGILDACQSGAITRLKGARMVEPFVVESQLKSEGSILITSSAPDENAQESDQLRGSFFTHNLISALRGAGDVSGDRRVTLMEAYQYAYNRTLVETKDSRGGAQHPMAAMNVDVQGDVVLTDLNSGRGGLRFHSDLAGDLLVADTRSVVMADFHKEGGKEAFLALPAGTYRIFCKDGRKTLQCGTRFKDKQVKNIGPDDLSAGFQFIGFAKGSSEKQASVFPWSKTDLPAQFPLRFGLGWSNTYFQFSPLALVGYRFWPHLGAYASLTLNKVHDRKLLSASNDMVAEFGLESGRFLSENFEFTGNLVHRTHKPMSYSYYVQGTCPDPDQGLCDVELREVNPSWEMGWQTGVAIGVRLWIWNRLSFAATYGTAWTWTESKFNPVELTLLPTVHF